MKQFIGILIVTCILLTGCSTTKNRVYVTPDSSYTEITYLDNLSFSVPLTIVNKATALTQIVDGMEYNSSDVYSFNNGVDTYILFCMDELIILAQKGTSFNFLNTEEKVNALNNSGVLNTWFTPSGKRFSYADSNKNNAYKIISNVKAEVVITSELYGDYSGKLAVIQSDNEEWSLFVGAVADSTKDLSSAQLSVIDGVTKSMYLKANVVKAEPTYDVVINQSLKTDAVQPPAEEELIEENTGHPDREDTVITVDSDATDVAVQPGENNNATMEDKPENTDTASRSGFNITNQRGRKKELDKAYSSDVYSMLQLGQCGILSVVTNDSVEEPIIRLNRIYTGDEAVKKIKQYTSTQEVYTYFDAPDGYTWNLVEYDVSYENCTDNPYINIKLIGLDGNNLVFRGVPVTKRTHDASYEMDVDGRNVYKMYCYYAVANGCHEYALECGDGTIDTENLSAAYYHITTK